LHVRCGIGYILNAFHRNERAVGIDDSEAQIGEVSRRYCNSDFSESRRNKPHRNLRLHPDFFCEDIIDIKSCLNYLKKNCHPRRESSLSITITCGSPLCAWPKEPDEAPQQHHNWVSSDDLADFMRLTKYRKSLPASSFSFSPSSFHSQLVFQ
jgi:hypothetical protein